MNIGILASSRYNVFATTLISALSTDYRQPAIVLVAEPPVYKQWRRLFKKRGFAGAIRRILEVTNIRRTNDVSPRRSLSSFARHREYQDWSLSIPKICQKHGIRYRRFNSANEPDAINWMGKGSPDILINAGGEILRREIINTPRYGILNAHMGPLPAIRGYNALEWSVLMNQEVGITLHFIDPGIDTGDIVAFKQLPIQSGDSLELLRARSFPMSVDLIVRSLKRMERDGISRKPQDPTAGRQYFAMHPRLLDLAEQKLRDRPSDQ